MTTDSAARAVNFVNGELVEAVGGMVREIVNPATEEVIAVVPEGGEPDVQRAVDAALAAATTWARMPPAERAARLLKLADRLAGHADEFATIESRNVGKPLRNARAEVNGVVDYLRFFAGAGRTLTAQAPGEYATGYTSCVRREPVGVVGLIAPWNYPLEMAVWKLGPALAAGNAVVLKPSEHTPLTALRLAELSADLLPPGVLNVITGDGVEVGAQLVSHPKVGMISLTGDVATGKEVARVAAAST